MSGVILSCIPVIYILVTGAQPQADSVARDSDHVTTRPESETT